MAATMPTTGASNQPFDAPPTRLSVGCSIVVTLPLLRRQGLTAREVDVLRLVARGLSSKEIARRLVISPKTARNHIEHIYTKIGASSRVAASLFAMEHGLLPAEGITSTGA